MSLHMHGQSPLKMRFEKSRFLDVSPKVQNVPHLFHAATWGQKKSCAHKNEMAVDEIIRGTVEICSKKALPFEDDHGKAVCLPPPLLATHRQKGQRRLPDNLADPTFVVSLFSWCNTTDRVSFC